VNGSKTAIQRIYVKYEGDLRTVAASLLNNATDAEDVVQDVYITFIKSMQTFELRSNLKGYLLTCVANKSRDYIRKRQRQNTISKNEEEQLVSETNDPLQLILRDEEVKELSYAMKELSYEHREAVVLRLHGVMKFKNIARLQNVSIKTAHSRYRGGLEKLKLILNGKLGT